MWHAFSGLRLIPKRKRTSQKGAAAGTSIDRIGHKVFIGTVEGVEAAPTMLHVDVILHL